MRSGSEVTRSVSLSLAVRPARLAILVPRIREIGWMNLFEVAMAAQSQFWGGQGNFPIPSMPGNLRNELFWTILEKLDADAVVVSTASYADMETIDPIWLKNWRDRNLARMREQFDGASIESLESTLDEYLEQPLVEPDPSEESSELKRRLGLFDSRSSTLDWVSGANGPSWPWMDATLFDDLPSEITNPIIHPQLGAARRLWATAQHGRLSPAAKKALSERDVVVNDHLIQTRKDWARWLRRHRDEPNLPWTFGESNLGWYRRRLGADKKVVVVGDSPWDFSLHYALRRWTSNSWWLPSVLRKDNDYLFSLSSELRRHSLGSDDSIVFVTTGRNFEARDLAASEMGEMFLTNSEISTARWQNVIPETVNRYYELGSEGRPEPFPLLGDRTPPVPTPTPARVSSIEPLQMHWVTEARIDGWAPLVNGELSDHLLPNSSHQYGRTSAGSLSYFCPNTMIFGGGTLESATTRPSIRPLSVLDQVRILLHPKGLECRPSDKGIWTTETVNLFGGERESSEALRHPIVRPLLDQFVGEARAKRRAQLSISDVSEATGVFGDANKVDELADVFEDLVQKQVLRRGLHLKCEKCRLKSWYSLEDLGDSYRCLRCRQVQTIQRGLFLGKKEPAWAYQLAPVVSQFLLHNGDLPLFAAQDELFGKAEAFDISYETEIRNPKTGKSELEVDFLANVDGRLWIGEATSKTGFQDLSKLDRLRDLATDTNAHGLIFATSRSGFGDATTKRIEELFTGRWPAVRYLTKVRTEREV